MQFAHPYFLWLLLLLPPAIWLKGRRGSSPAFLYSSLKLIEGLSSIRRSRAGRFLAALRWLALALLIVALARPHWMKSRTVVKASGIDIAVAFDLSGSMNTPDYVINNGQISRFNVAKTVLEKFIAGRPDDRIGLVAFAKRAFIATPLTLDHNFLLEDLNRLSIGVIDPDSTAIGDGLVTALNRLRDLKAKSKIIILMTDGGNNAGRTDPVAAAQAAAALGVKIYTIGLGNRQLVEEMGLPADYLPDTDLLQNIARVTDGKFYRARNTGELKAIYGDINKLEKSTETISKFTQYKEFFPWLVSTGLALLLAEAGLAQTILRRLP
ncbi:MAG: VWA domain-containing protein [Verrucomicrobia bacterium]|nr:VWA domain-containing protein [Verrucomicrobiota bacterium]MDE3098497.1 VWA domain-containing protein [Verrucomicrobiota bacterium]